MKNIINTIKKVAVNTTRSAKKNSPEILLVTGIVGVIGSVVLACRATIKAQDIIDDAKENVEKVHECENNKELVESGKYTEQDAKKDMTIIYVKTALNLTKSYAPSIILGTLSLTGIVCSNRILRKRNVALAAAYATIDKSFKEYKNRVIERFGEKVEKEIRYNIKAQEVEEKVVDENGNETVEKKIVEVMDPSKCSGYARFFDECSPYWTKDPEYNLTFLRAQQNYANDLLVSRSAATGVGYVFLNEVYDMLGIDKTVAGQTVGWIYDANKNDNNDYIDFGIYDGNKMSNRLFVNGYERSILLDFNVTGDIINRVPFELV